MKEAEQLEDQQADQQQDLQAYRHPFFYPIILFHYSSVVGALLSLFFVLAILHPLQFLHHRLSVIDVDVIGCRVVVELRSRLYMLRCVHPSKHMLHIEPIYLG